MTWQEVALFGPAPSPRRLHAAVPSSGRLLFFGGARCRAAMIICKRGKPAVS